MPLLPINWMNLLRKVGGPSGPVQLTTDELFWLDGTVDGNEFVDKSGNGRNFTITGKDFTANYFPYKSAATISAPAGDAVLIAADINNFLYDAGGDPNAIPVVSFFQNIDYENKLFCRHIAQVVDGNDVETTEPSVVDIVLYSAVLTGADLTAANTYYGITTESGVDVYLSKDGADINGGTSWIDAVLTFVRATALMTVDKLLHGRTGIYVEDASIVGENKGLGRNQITLATNASIVLATGATLEGFIINGDDLQYAIRTTAVDGTTIVRCYVQNVANGGVISKGTGDGLLIKDTVLNLDAASVIFIYAEGDSEIDGCLFAGVGSLQTVRWSSVAGVKSLKHSTLIAGGTGRVLEVAVDGDYTVFDNKFISPSAFNYVVYFNGSLAPGTFAFKYNYVLLPALVNSVIYSPSAITWDLDIQYNVIDVPNTPGEYLFNLVEQQSLLFKYNIINNTDTVYVDGSLRISQDSGSTDLFEVSYNTFYGLAKIRADDMVNCVIKGNKLINTLALNHNGINMQVGHVNTLYNYLNEAQFHISYGYMRTGEDMLCGYNILVNATYNYLTDLGSSYSNFFNNLILRDSRVNGNSYQYVGIFIEEYDGDGTPTDNAKIFNNIFILDFEQIAGDQHNHIYIEQNTCLVGFESDYNIFYSTRTDGKMFRIVGDEYTFAEWQGLGYDLNSVLITDENDMKALFVDYDNYDYRLVAGSLAIGAGKVNGALHEDGLSPATAWGDDDELPSVVTISQPLVPSCGPYVYGGRELGPELVVNGILNNTTGWTAGNCTFTASGGRGIMTATSTSNAQVHAALSSPLVEGNSYRWVITQMIPSANPGVAEGVQLSIVTPGQTYNDYTKVVIDNKWESYMFDFVAGSALTNIYLYMVAYNGTRAGYSIDDIVQIDNISLKEIL